MKTIFTFIMVWILSDQSPTSLLLSKNESDFGVTENAEALKDFKRGLLLLHNFEYPDAKELFHEAQKKDPLFGLAYWGEAMTYNHPVMLYPCLVWLRVGIKRFAIKLLKFQRSS